MAATDDLKRDLRAAFPEGAFVNLILESGGETFPARIPVPDPADFVLVAPCDGRFFLGIYEHRFAGEPDVVLYVPKPAKRGDTIHFG